LSKWWLLIFSGCRQIAKVERPESWRDFLAGEETGTRLRLTTLRRK
jgi:hypothetical protein